MNTNEPEVFQHTHPSHRLKMKAFLRHYRALCVDIRLKQMFDANQIKSSTILSAVP